MDRKEECEWGVSIVDFESGDTSTEAEQDKAPRKCKFRSNGGGQMETHS